ncbi:MAG: C10 family peptidase [Muribaculaceae bacterium]|nr:C10 family peptidase [Muribaculaceae bacterium]
MKIKHLLTLVTLSFPFIGTYANVLTPEEALSRLDLKGTGVSTRGGNSSYKLRFTLSSSVDEPTLYIFNREEGKGFMVVSADDNATPLLGYSDNDNFDPDKMPSQLKYWLQEYSRQIEAARNSGVSAESTLTRVSVPDWAPIAPLVTAKWNQGDPYNLYCYEITSDGKENKSVTGCVATAMAQVMYYFKYPEVGKGSVEYQHPGSGEYSMNFGAEPFQWDEMLPTYLPGSYTTEEADAVSYLMKACGYGVHMNYGEGESGASGSAIAPALINYFGYNEDMVVRSRHYYTYSDWMAMIYKNLSECGPVIYDGSALDGGHSFVCDGYDGNGYFHINWGWGGMSDGYYLLDALNADEFGIGGAAGGFNLGQQVILGIDSKNNGLFNHELLQSGTLVGKVNGETLSLALEDGGNELQYVDPLTVDVIIGLSVINQSDGSQQAQYIELKPVFTGVERGHSWKLSDLDPKIDLSRLSLTDGDTYEITLSAIVESSKSSGWQPVEAMPGNSNTVNIVKDGNEYKVTNYTQGKLEVTDFRITNEKIYQNLPLKLSSTFTNAGDVALTRNYSAVFFDKSGTESYKTENYSVNIDAGSSETIDWSALQWYKENGATDITEATEFTVKLYDNWEGSYVSGIEETVMVYPEPDDLKVEGTLSIIGAQKDGDVYVVDSTDFEAQITVKVLEGYFTSTINLGIEAPLSDGKYYTLMHKHFDAVPDLAAGEEESWTMEMSLPEAEPGKIYKLRIWSQAGEFAEPISLRFNINPGSVDSIEADALYEVYSISGYKVLTTGSLSEIESLPHGLYIINGKKVAL